jgi:hypothetical protein
VDAIAEDLPLKSQIGADMLGRAPRGAAYALKGKAALYLGQDDLARQAFQKVVGSGEYSLQPNYFDNYRTESENGSGSVFEIQFVADQSGNPWVPLNNSSLTSFHDSEYAWDAFGNVFTSTTTADNYEAGDPRIEGTHYGICDRYNVEGEGDPIVIGTSANPPSSCPNPPGPGEKGQEIGAFASSPSNMLPKKFTTRYKEPSWSCCADGINFQLIRYSNVLLGLAEAQIALGNITTPGNGSPSAQNLMNRLRGYNSARSSNPAWQNNLDPYPTSEYGLGSAEEAYTTLFHAYAVEHAFDSVLWGVMSRYLDQQDKPTAPVAEQADESLSQVQSQRYLPIPQEEIDNNPEISADVNN